jgi:RimJ/RimL family protein N-acetyltransferase
MNKRSEVLVDGGGVGRVLQAVLYGANEEALRLRAASQEDVLLLWQWANDPVTRRNSFVPEPISWAVQEAWYEEKIASPDTRFWILECRHVPVGQIRYDRIDADTAQINFSVAPAYRGRSFDSQLLRLSADLAGRELGVRTVVAISPTQNFASNHAFLSASFEVIEEKRSLVAMGSCFGISVHRCPTESSVSPFIKTNGRRIVIETFRRAIVIGAMSKMPLRAA